MVILCDEIIWYKSEQGLIYIPGDLVVTKHARLWILGMIISGSEFIISHKSWNQWKCRKGGHCMEEPGCKNLGSQWTTRKMG